MQNKIINIGSIGSTSNWKTVSKPLQIASAFVLGMLLLYGAAIVQTSTVHNASHDVRHSQGFPCH